MNLTRQTNNIFVEAFIDEHDCITRAKCADAIAWMWKYQNTKVDIFKLMLIIRISLLCN